MSFSSLLTKLKIMTEKLMVRNPRTGESDYELTVTSSDEIRRIATELKSTQKSWRDGGVESRINTMQRWKVELQERHTDILLALETDTGRRRIANGEILGLIGMIEQWCSIAPELLASEEWNSRTMPNVALQQQLEPFPILGVISPWNFPLLLSFIDAVPALIAGCSVMIKPSEVTPRFATVLSETIAAIPELDSVLRFVCGDGRSGAALVSEVDAIAFTGSVATGKKVAAAAADAFIPAFLELGGKDPAIVLPGSDIDRATTAILRASVAATGQACQSIERIYVHRSQSEEFVSMLAAKARSAPLSFPDISNDVVGPLIFERQAEIILDHINDAVAKGARIKSGGKLLRHGGGVWLEPTVLDHVDHSMAIMMEETFGPVMPVMVYETPEQALELANDTCYGLSAAVFGPDEAAAIAFGRSIDAGGISINDAGMTTMIFEACKSAFNLSGMGPSRMGPTGLTRFLRQKALYINRGDVVTLSSMAESEDP